MRIISVEDPVVTYQFSELADGDVFQKVNDKRLYLKSSISSGEGGNAVRLATGLRSTFEADLEVVRRDDAAILFNVAED